MPGVDYTYAADISADLYAADLVAEVYAANLTEQVYAADIEIIGASVSYYWMLFNDGNIMLYEDGTVMEFEVN